MKKFLLLILAVFFLFSNQLIAQSINYDFTSPASNWSGNEFYDFGNVPVGTTSSESYFAVTVSGFVPTVGPPMVVSAPGDFKVSLTSGGPYSDQVSIPIAGGGFSWTTIYVVCEPTQTGFIGGFIEFRRDINGFVDNTAYPYGNGTAAQVPVMEIVGPIPPGNPVPNGSTNPSLLNGTFFGSVAPGATASRTFTINNTGSVNLNLTDLGSSTYIEIKGRNPDKFTPTSQPSTPIIPEGSTTFTIQFGPETKSEYYEATITIYSDDPVNNPYTFTVGAFVPASLPSLTDPTAAANVTVSSAQASSEVTSDGGASVTERGMCWKVSGIGGPPTTANFKSIDGGFGIGSFTATMNNLAPETNYWYRAFATNSVGTAYAPASSSQDFWTLSLEPTNHPTIFTATAFSTTQINLSFSPASSIGSCDGYLILRKQGTFPDVSYVLDGNAYIPGTDLGSGTYVQALITNIAQTTAQATGLSPSTEYCFTIIPYNWNGVNAPTYNYLTFIPLSDCEITSAASSTWNGTGSWNTPENWSNGVPGVTTNAIIAQSDPGDPLVVDENVSCNDLTIQQGAYVTINTGRTLTVNGSLLMESNAFGSASLITKGTINVTGSTTVEQYLQGNKRSMVSTPTTGSTYATLQASPNTENDFYRWDEPTCYWIDLNNGDPPGTPLTLGEGYHVLYNLSSGAPAIKEFTGPVNTNNISPSITYSGPTSYIGWNLVGNSFPCAIDWDLTGWVKDNLEATIYLFNGTQYLSWNGSTGGITQGVLPPMQGFFVKANGTGGPYGLTIPTAARLHDPQVHFKSDLANLLKLVVVMEGSEIIDETYINFNSDATPGFDAAYDGYKLPGTYLPEPPGMEGSFQLYSIVPGDMLSINVLPPSEGGVTVKLGFEAKEDGLYTITPFELSSFESDMDITLEDLRDDVIVNLKESGGYQFTASPSDVAERFLVHFSGPYAINEVTSNSNIRIWSFDNNIYLDNENNLSGQIVIYDVMGQEVLRKGLEGELNVIGMTNQSGYYIVRVLTDQHLETQKVFIK